MYIHMLNGGRQKTEGERERELDLHTVLFPKLVGYTEEMEVKT